METFTHPRTGAQIDGIRLLDGSVICQNDRYEATDGSWQSNHNTVGLTIQPGCSTIWVRQTGLLSQNAHILIGYLNLHGSCIGERHGTYYVIPEPTFNWDPRVDFYSQRVEHPECLQELVDHGYLVFGEHITQDGGTNRIIILTDEGKRTGALLS